LRLSPTWGIAVACAAARPAARCCGWRSLWPGRVGFTISPRCSPSHGRGCRVPGRDASGLVTTAAQSAKVIGGGAFGTVYCPAPAAASTRWPRKSPGRHPPRCWRDGRDGLGPAVALARTVCGRPATPVLISSNGTGSGERHGARESGKRPRGSRNPGARRGPLPAPDTGCRRPGAGRGPGARAGAGQRDTTGVWPSTRRATVR